MNQLRAYKMIRLLMCIILLNGCFATLQFKVSEIQNMQMRQKLYIDVNIKSLSCVTAFSQDVFAIEMQYVDSINWGDLFYHPIIASEHEPYQYKIMKNDIILMNDNITVDGLIIYRFVSIPGQHIPTISVNDVHMHDGRNFGERMVLHYPCTIDPKKSLKLLIKNIYKYNKNKSEYEVYEKNIEINIQNLHVNVWTMLPPVFIIYMISELFKHKVKIFLE